MAQQALDQMWGGRSSFFKSDEKSPQKTPKTNNTSCRTNVKVEELSEEIPENYYEVEEILAQRVRRGKLEYRVKWKGWALEESTWEPEAGVRQTEAAKEFKLKQKSSALVPRKSESSKHKLRAEEYSERGESFFDSLEVRQKSFDLSVQDKKAVDQEVVGISQDPDKRGKWIIYIKEVDKNNEEVEIKLLEYSCYKKVCPEKIIDFFEKHLEFTEPNEVQPTSDSDKENINI